ncbi:MAG TPA: hypothetical protein VMV09_03785 [Candidatus Saccharimonadales bacterium]|nr:hypothetical protein [Candidatus Saccharimonadales bacterium]
MRSSQAASAVLAAISMTLLVSACASGGEGGAKAGATCTGSGPSAEVVVELGDHRVLDRCVNFKGASISGESALHRSGIEFATQHFSFGDGVCQIDNQPKSYSTCFPSGQPYWALFFWSGKGKWKAPTTGISGVALKSGEALGWRYDPSSGTALPPPLPPKS